MKLKLKDIVLLSLMSALMCAGDFLMEWLPNVHLVGVFIVVATVVYRKYALFPIYVYVLIQGIVSGFGPWWMAYLYIWAVLWAVIMLIPKRLPEAVRFVIYVVVCAMHGFLFGVLFSPVQAIMFGLDFKGTLAWITAGFYFDIVHGVGNLILGSVLIFPMVKILKHSDQYLKK